MDGQHIGMMFQHAALAPEQWIGALEAMASATHSYRGQLIGIGGDRAVPFNWVTHSDDAILTDFVAIDGGNPAVSFRVAAGEAAGVGEVVAERDYAARRRQIGENSYEAFCTKFDLPFGAQTVLARDPGRMIGLALLRTHADGATSAADRALFAAVVPHVRAAVDLQTAIEARGLQLLLGNYDAIAAAAILVDSRGAIVDMTPTAERVLRDTPQLDVAGGAFRCRTPRDSLALTQGISAVLSGTVPAIDLVLLGEHGLPLAASIYALPATEWSLRHVPHVIVVLRARTTSAATLGAMLRTTYGLTQAEAEIAVAIDAGVERHAIAAARGAALGTVRQQIKTIFAKLGVRREAELLTLIAALSGRHG